jgi:hypothetical protein
MPSLGRTAVLMAGLAAGCRGPCVSTPPAASTAPLAPTALPPVRPTPIEPPAAGLPPADPASATLPVADPEQFRGLTEPDCRAMAAAHSATADLLDAEGGRPTPVPCHGGHHRPPPADPLADARRYAALDARNRAAADALDRFFQLADAEGRAELLAAGLRAFDRLRDGAAGFRAAGLPVPADDELLRQRAKLLADGEQAEAGIRLLNAELKGRIGLDPGGPERLWPVGPFGVSAGPVDVERAVRAAVEGRPDLLLIRSIITNLSADTLPAAREQLRAVSPLAGAAPAPTAGLLRRLGADAEKRAAAEVPLRRRQAEAVLADRERQAAAEVRAAADQMASAVRRVGLARAAAESWKAKVDRSDKPADRLPAEIEWLKARAAVVAAVMDWHRWRVRFVAAQGALVGGCGE